MPGMEVSIFSYTTAPLVRRSISAPSSRVSSFSGRRPTLSSRVSHSKVRSVPGMGCRRSSTADTTTFSRRFSPIMLVTVWDRYRGISKSWRHWTIFRFRPLE